MIGDFGFVSESFDDSEMVEKHKIGTKVFSNTKIVVSSAVSDTFDIKDEKMRQNFVDVAAKQLKEEIIRNRGINLDMFNVIQGRFRKTFSSSRKGCSRRASLNLFKQLNTGISMESLISPS